MMNFYNALFSLVDLPKTGAFCLLVKQFYQLDKQYKGNRKKIKNFACILNNGKLVMMGFGILVYKGKRKYEKRVILSKSLYVEARAW